MMVEKEKAKKADAFKQSIKKFLSVWIDKKKDLLLESSNIMPMEDLVEENKKELIAA